MRTSARWIPPEQVEQARQMDLLTYLQTYEPHELVHVRGDVYTTRTNDSLKLSNGKWMRWSTGDGGKSALDYLIKVRGMSFQDAVLQVCGLSYAMPPPDRPPKPEQPPAPFVLPEPHINNDRVLSYLRGRGIDSALLHYCVRTGRLYESAKYHNCCFVGHDLDGVPRHAMLRGSSPHSSFKQEVARSDKRFSFSLMPAKGAKNVHVFESAIDLLSFLTLERMACRDISQSSYIALNGVYLPRKRKEETAPPLALAQYLKDHPEIERIFPCLDNDTAGRGCAQMIQAVYGLSYDIDLSRFPREKDYNAQLQKRLGIQQIEKGAIER